MRINKPLLLFIIGIVLVMLVFFSAVIGGYISCERGEGDLVGFSCMNLNVTEVCEYQGRIYKIPEDSDEGLWIT